VKRDQPTVSALTALGLIGRALSRPAAALLLFVGLSSTASAQTTFAQDSFTDAANTTLQLHTPNVGSSWTKFIGGGGTDLQISGTGDNLVDASAKNLSGYINTSTPTGGATEYVVGCTATWNSGKATDIVTLDARVNGAQNDRYQATINSGSTTNNVVIQKVVGGTTTVLATGSLDVSTTTGVAHYLVFSVKNATKSFNIDGTTIISTTDNTITASGVGGLEQEGNKVGDTVVDDFFESTFSATAVRLSSFTATRHDDKIFLQWKTGYEVDNLGFRVYRERDGVRTRINPTLIAGSALLVKDVGTRSGRTYGWWDADSPDAKPNAEYWLEDVDLNGTTTWHGPIRAVESDRDVPPNVESRLLNRLTRHPRAPSSDRNVDPSSSGLSTAPVPSVGSEPSAPLAPGHPSTHTVTGVPPTLASSQTPPPAVIAPPPPAVDLAPPAPSSAASVSALATDQRIAGHAALKVGVTAEGWYRVSRAAVAAAGVNAASLRLTVDGVEQPLRLTRDAVEFYGSGVDTPYTDTRVYWLSAGGGRPIPTIVAATTQPPPASSFPFTVVHQDRETYFAALLNGDASNFFGEIVTTEPTGITLPLVHVDPAFTGTAWIEVVLQGVTDAAEAPDGHAVTVQLNGQPIGTVEFSGLANVSKVFRVPATLLVDGDNVVTVAAANGDADVTLVDTLRLTYAHTYTADADRLRLTAAGGHPVVVTGFSAPAIRVVDVTDPGAIVELRGRVSRGSNGYQVAFAASGTGTRTLLAFTDAQVWTPSEMVANQPSSWASARNAADYVVIAPRAFIPAVLPLAALRQARGHTVAVVDIEDVYDEFSFGQKTPFAIRDFLMAAHAGWRTPPRYVLLVGNATNDPRNYQGMNEPDWMPTKLIDTTVLETASDDWFVDVNGDGVPDLAALGRLPARTVEQAALMIEKIVAYEAADDASDWTRQVTLVADANRPDDFDFARQNVRLGAAFPSVYDVTQIARGLVGTAAARTALFEQINAGRGIVHYTGHGSEQIWHDDLLTTDDGPLLTNGARLPVFVLMDCLNGLFHSLFPEESLAETLMRAPEGGAVAVWASSGFTGADSQVPLSDAFYRLLFSGRYATLGEVVGAAKARTPDVDVRRTWIFFGDPALRLKGMPHIR
jgi:hypothetical protein